ncbi:EamA/RhaT family transporter, partial [Acinetobacter baumannii]
HELPDLFSIIGIFIILFAILLCNPFLQKKLLSRFK